MVGEQFVYDINDRIVKSIIALPIIDTFWFSWLSYGNTTLNPIDSAWRFIQVSLSWFDVALTAILQLRVLLHLFSENMFEIEYIKLDVQIGSIVR